MLSEQLLVGLEDGEPLQGVPKLTARLPFTRGCPVQPGAGRGRGTVGRVRCSEDRVVSSAPGSPEGSKVLPCCPCEAAAVSIATMMLSGRWQW